MVARGSERSPRAVAPWRPRPLDGALVGVVVVLGFAVLHQLLIVSIWFNITAMLVAGAATGACLVWSFLALGEPTTRAWAIYLGECTVLLVALGAVSIAVLEPRFTIAELIDDPDALARLMPGGLPLMVAALPVGTAALWLRHGRVAGSAAPLLITQLVLVVLVGHNFALLGLVESSSRLLAAFGEFVGLTVLLAASFAWGVHLLVGVRHRAA